DLRRDGHLPAGRDRRHASPRRRGAELLMPRILETRRLSRAFGALRAVSDVDLAVEPGELRAIIGPNGAGKTTLFHLISGVLQPTAGQVLFRSADVTALAAPVRCRRGMS